MWCFNKKYLRNIFPQAIEDEVISFGTKDVMADKPTLTYERMKKEGGLKKENYFHIFDEAEGQKLQKKPSLYMVSY